MITTILRVILIAMVAGIILVLYFDGSNEPVGWWIP